VGDTSPDSAAEGPRGLDGEASAPAADVAARFAGDVCPGEVAGRFTGEECPAEVAGRFAGDVCPAGVVGRFEGDARPTGAAAAAIICRTGE